MKKLALLSLVSILGLGLIFPSLIRAQEPSVLAVMTTAKATPLPQIVYGQEVNYRDLAISDLVLAGGQVNMGGLVNKNLVVAGGHVTISGEVKGNVIAVGGDVIVDQGAHIGGYLVSAGGKVELNGKVDGDTRVYSGEMTASDKSFFGGSLITDAGKITADKARVNGERKLTEMKSNSNMPWGYWAKSMPRQPQNRSLAGAISFFKGIELVGKIIFMLLLIKIFGSHLASIYKIVTAEMWSLMGWGLAKLFLTPLFIILLLMTVIGIPVAVIFGTLYFVAMFLSVYVSSAVLGHWFTVKGWITTKSLYWQGVAGLLALEILGLVPVVGWLLKFGALLLGMGLFVRWEKMMWAKKA